MTIEAVLAIAATVVGALVSAIVAQHRQRTADQEKAEKDRDAERGRSQKRIDELEAKLATSEAARIATAEKNVQFALEVSQRTNDALDKIDAVARALNSRGGQ